MAWLRRQLIVPASESQTTLTLCVSLVLMSLMLWGLVWQASVIDQQRVVIRLLWHAH